MSPRIASLFTGTGALDLAVQDVYGGELIWHSQYEPPNKDGRADRHQWAAQILARHWPTVPNLGDITAIDWRQVLDTFGSPDILTGGFPCQDVSSAGKRVGLAPDSRSGLWTHMARAIAVLRPKLVIIENVQGLLSAKADRDLGPDREAVDEGAPGGVLRALGAVLGDLATLGLDAEWARLGASEIGAPHNRNRVFINAWPAAEDADRTAGGERRIAAPGQEEAGRARPDTGGRGGAPAAHTDGRRREGNQKRHRGTEDGQPERQRGLDTVGRRVQRAVAADSTRVGRREGRTESARVEGRPDAALGGSSTPADTGGSGRGQDVTDLRSGQPDLDWGSYGPAIRRWEHTLGRRAPSPVDDLGRLNPPFVEWMMGLPAGWVVDTPGITRPAALKALGNGVVRQQAAAALRLLWERMPVEARLPLAARPALKEAA